MSDIYKGATPHDHIGMGEDFVEHHGVMGMKWGVRRYQPYPNGAYIAGKNASGRSKRLAMKADKAHAKTESLRKERNDAARAKDGYEKADKRFLKADKKEEKIGVSLSKSIRKDDEKVSNWKNRENARLEKEYSKEIDRYEKLANKYLDKYDSAKPSQKEGYARSYAQSKYRANIERGKLSSEKSFVKNAKMSDIQHERKQLLKGAATCAVLSGVMGVVSAGVFLPITPLIIPNPSAIKTSNRIDDKTQASIEKNASRVTAKSVGATSKEIQRQYQEDLERRRRAIREANQTAARRAASLGVSNGTNPFMFG